MWNQLTTYTLKSLILTVTSEKSDVSTEKNRHVFFLVEAPSAATR